MRNLQHLDEYRVEHLQAGWGDEFNGAFLINLPTSRLSFQVIASNGLGWDHVSVSLEERMPKWDEMQQMKDLFFEQHETVIQIHPAKEKYINMHPNCLHLWRPTDQPIPVPPIWMV